MAAGKHIGKVLLKIREEEPNKIQVPELMPHLAKPRYTCRADECYIVLGKTTYHLLKSLTIILKLLLL